MSCLDFVGSAVFRMLGFVHSMDFSQPKSFTASRHGVALADFVGSWPLL